MHQDSIAQAAGPRKIRYASSIDRIGIRLVVFASVDISISSAIEYNVIGAMGRNHTSMRSGLTD